MENCKCEAYKNGFCFGCYETVVENFENNFFDYYEHQKRCKTLEEYNERKKRNEF